MAGLDSATDSFFHRYFVFRPLHLSNQFAAYFMMSTGDFGDREGAERIAWMVLFAAFCAVVVGNLRVLRRDAVVFSLLFFPIFSGAIVTYGFMNFVLGVILFIQSCFLLQFGQRRPSKSWMAGFVAAAVATYVAHPLAGLILGATVGPFALAYLLRWRAAGWERSSGSFSSLVPIGCALACGMLAALAIFEALPQIIDFVVIAGRGAVGGSATVAAAVEDSWRRRLIDVLGLSYFVSYSPADYVFSLLFGLVIGWLGLRRVLAFRRMPVWRAADEWLASLAALFILSLIVPRGIDYFLPERLAACLLDVLLLWLSASPLGGRGTRALAIVGLLLNVGFCTWRMQWGVSINTVLNEYAGVLPFIPDNTSVVAITTSPSYLQANCRAVRARALPCRFRPTLDFLGGRLAGRPVALLSNYQLRPESGFFPITLRAPWDQYARYIPSFERWPPPAGARGDAVIAGAAALVDHHPPDIIVTWDERIATGAATGFFPDAAAPLLRNYTKVFTSSPLGAGSVYVKRQP